MRRLPVAVIALLLVVLVAACTGSGPGPSPTSTAAPVAGGLPNIVFVLTDDLQWNLVSHMPHVVAMQQAGTTLSSYYVVDSLCCPSRSAIFTGEYPHDDGVFTNTGQDGGYAAYNAHGNQDKTFALALQQAGYTTGFMGKYLNGYDPKDPVPPGWNTWDVAGNGYPEFDYDLNENGTVRHYGKDPQDYLVDVMSGKAGSFIDASASSGKPFLLELATFAPHAPYTPAPRYATAAASVAYPKTPAFDTLPADAPSWLAGRTALTGKQQATITSDYQKRVEADLAVDDMIGHVEDTLKAKGIADNTYIVFSSDNGYHMGEYRLMPGKQTAMDTDIHVPLVVTGPHVPAGRTSDLLASNIDLCPTFEQLAGAAVGSNVDGVSLADIWHGQTPSDWQQAVLVEHHGPNDQPDDPDAQGQERANPPSYEAVRTAQGLYVAYGNGGKEYYDTTADPDELKNIASQGIPDAMTKALPALQNCHGAQACQAAAHG